MDPNIILSHYQTQSLLKARKAGAHHVQSSIDLGLTKVEITIDQDRVKFPGGHILKWESIEKISLAMNSCFVIENDLPRKIQVFSKFTNRTFSLMPTSKAPTMLISGLLMHRIKGTDPYSDTVEKINTLKPIVGPVLDTATGLGYTAIAASKTAEHVTTIELDAAALEMAVLNPWSKALFNNPKISQHIGDARDVIKSFAAKSFTRIIHDPPTLSLAGNLYAREFYKELFRVLRTGGMVFHYIGNPDSKSGHKITRGVIKRFKEVGFSRIKQCPRAFGVLAFK